MFQVLSFAIVSAGIIALSLKSLLKPRAHGFYRFFAFESILGAIVLNAEYWFRAPLSWLQLISWVLLVISAVLAWWGFRLLLMVGKPQGGVESTSMLVVKGAYRYIRHPLYGSLLWLGWGAFVKAPSALAGILVSTATIFLVITARVEEAENAQKFGAEYTSYMKKTKMFIPFVV